MLHEKLQAAMKKDGGYGGKGGDGKYDDKKEGGYDGKDGGKKEGGYDGKYDKKEGEHDGKDDDKKPLKKAPMEKKGGNRRQLDGHDHGDKQKAMEKKNYEKDGKEYKKEDYNNDEGKKDGDYKKDDGKDKKDVEPSAELKAAMKACTENELCKKLMECKKKHKESG